MSTLSLPSEMFEHYQQIEESKRLSNGVGELEKLRTQDILKRHLPPAPATVLDVGGAAGVHAFWLAGQGYSVHLSDPVKHHIETALETSKKQSMALASCEIGDARAINRPDSSADAVLMLDPLYHLINREDRIVALKEARRVLKPGGLLFAATVSRFASMIDGFSRDLISDPVFVEIIKQDLKNGQHRNPSGRLDYFTTTFFHHPKELMNEMTEAGFKIEKLLGVEGPFWYMQEFSNQWEVPEKQKFMLDILRTVEEEPHILGASAHPMGIGRK